jgi:hypothetical protein
MKLTTLNSNRCAAGQTITLDLPSNVLLCLDSLSLSGTLVTSVGGGSNNITGGAAVLGRHAESLISRLDVEIGGVSINNACNNYNLLAHILTDATCGTDVINRRKVLHSGLADGGITGTALRALGTTSNTVGGVTSISQPIAISNFIGFLGSGQILDTGLVSGIRIRFTLAGPEILLVSGATPANPTFELQNISFTVAAYDIADGGLYYESLKRRVEGGSVLEVPFDNYSCFTATNPGLQNSIRFGINTASLDTVIATFRRVIQTPENLPITGTNQNVAFKVPGTFVRIGGNGTIAANIADSGVAWQYNVNGILFNNFRQDCVNTLTTNWEAMGILEDSVAGIHPDCNSLSAFLTQFWFAMVSFTYADPDHPEKLVAGLNTLGANTMASFDYSMPQSTLDLLRTNAAGTVDPLLSHEAVIFAKAKSVLQISSGRMIQCLS